MIGVAQLVVAAVAVIVVILGVFEYTRIRELRRELEVFRAGIQSDIFRAAKAQQRIMASYRVADIEQKIALLESAAETYPDAFNVYNALGWAHME